MYRRFVLGLSLALGLFVLIPFGRAPDGGIARAAPMMAPVPDITGDCVTVVFTDDTFQTEQWANVHLIDNRRRAVVIRMFHKADGVQASFEDVFSWDGGAEVVSLRSLPNGDLMVRCTSESPNDATQFVQQPGDHGGNIAIDDLPVNQRAHAHSTQSVEFFMVQDSAKIDAAIARTDVGPCSNP